MPWKTTCQKVQRREFIQAALRRKTPLSELCEAWGISRKTAYKWLGRFQERGQWGLTDQSHAARRISRRPSACWLARIRRWRARHPALASAASALGSPQTALGAATAFWASPTAFDRGDRSLAQGVGIDAQTPPPGPQGAADGTAQTDGGLRAQ